MKTEILDADRNGTRVRRVAAGLLLLVMLATGCASGPNANPRDPLEPFNREVTKFNEAIDAAVLKPVAIGYVTVVPSLMRTGVSNFFSNLGDAWSFVNNVLQLKPQAAAESLMRFNVNTFLGLGGLLDIASEMNIDRHKEDFGGCLPALTWWCRSWDPPPCATPLSCQWRPRGT
jgi:phospholipid-binding lipoprotein MlaA